MADQIDITFPDGASREFPVGVTALDVAKSIGPHLASEALAAAVTELFPDAHPGIGPPTENGFYYDLNREKPFTEEDLANIEAKMQELVKANLPNEHVYFPKEEGLK